jgi:hypothetical protein
VLSHYFPSTLHPLLTNHELQQHQRTASPLTRVYYIVRTWHTTFNVGPLTTHITSNIIKCYLNTFVDALFLLFVGAHQRRVLVRCDENLVVGHQGLHRRLRGLQLEISQQISHATGERKEWGGGRRVRRSGGREDGIYKQILHA